MKTTRTMIITVPNRAIVAGEYGAIYGCGTSHVAILKEYIKFRKAEVKEETRGDAIAVSFTYPGTFGKRNEQEISVMQKCGFFTSIVEVETISGDFEYQPHKNQLRNPTRCSLEITRRGNDALVIATELSASRGNHGMSITNSSEQLATELVRRFHLYPETTTFIEHYGPMSYAGDRTPDHYSQVTYTWEGEQASRPGRKAITVEQIEAIKASLREPQAVVI